MKLLNFVALYGLLLMPMGAVIFADHWLFPKIGLEQNHAERHGLAVNWPAAAAWGVSLLAVFLMPMEIFFKGLPGWFIAVVLYTLLSMAVQKKNLRALNGGRP